MTKQILEKAIAHAEKQKKADCIFCRVGMEFPIMVFSASPAFLSGNDWYHLHLCHPRSNAMGGYNWKECESSVHNKYLTILSDTVPLTWQEAAKIVEENKE